MEDGTIGLILGEQKKILGKSQGPIYTMGPFTNSDRGDTKSFWRDGVNVRLSTGELAFYKFV